jgi:threonine/homoserine/homoserine lactone efflux protein
MPEQFLPFLGVVLVLTITPGPDMVLVLRNGMSSGPRAAWITGFGCCTGIALYALTAAFGLAAFLQTSPQAFEVVRWVGALYLVYLGIRAVLAARNVRHAGPGGAFEAGSGVPVGEAYRQGVISNVLNPKIALLFLTLIPQFITVAEPKMRTSVILAITFLGIAIVWWSLFAVGLRAIGAMLSKRANRVWIERLAGVVLIALGARIILG